MQAHEKWIREAIKLAEKSVEAGNLPWGALLVCRDGRILTAQNTAIVNNHHLQHAEMNLVQLAISALRPDERENCTLYASGEPCAMCAGAIYWARIPTVVFGASTEAVAALSGPSLDLPCRDVFRSSDRNIEVIGPVLQAEALELHKKFWKSDLAHVTSGRD